MLESARWQCASSLTSGFGRHLLCLPSRRSLLTLAIETSCDDTSVAILEKLGSRATLHFHEKVTADNTQFRGVHPLRSLESHQANLGNLINKAVRKLSLIDASHSRFDGPSSKRRHPDLISVTRGPGMRTSLFTGLDTAKGLAIAWQIPLIGVNHMQAHSLTPRLAAAMEYSNEKNTPGLKFPFISLLVSGGHTLLVNTKSLIDHSILATTADIAIGDALDKIARAVLPPEIIQLSGEIMYGRLLDHYCFPTSSSAENLDYAYIPPTTRLEELKLRQTKWGWALGAPLAHTRQMKFSFSGLESACGRIVEDRGATMDEEEKRELGTEAMRVAFEHLASRIIIALQSMNTTACNKEHPDTLVVSGGVASNKFLRAILRAYLDIRGYQDVQLSFPPVELCTDNAAMIGWAGIEMFEAGYQSELSCTALRKWSLDPDAEDGGILGVGGWKKEGSLEGSRC
ncbi:hypothetical protein MMC14_000981 [Varicellaria rhodocarpa]|nr:hypothetical protein [Varicellaria rhodocarpa]